MKVPIKHSITVTFERSYENHVGVKVLAALNPYRLRPASAGAVGLVFKQSESFDDPMSRLVYRVHPIPATMKVKHQSKKLLKILLIF